MAKMNLPSGDAFAKVPSSLYREETEIKFWTAYRNFYQKQHIICESS